MKENDGKTRLRLRNLLNQVQLIQRWTKFELEEFSFDYRETWTLMASGSSASEQSSKMSASPPWKVAFSQVSSAHLVQSGVTSSLQISRSSSVGSAVNILSWRGVAFHSWSFFPRESFNLPVVEPKSVENENDFHSLSFLDGNSNRSTESISRLSKFSDFH